MHSGTVALEGGSSFHVRRIWVKVNSSYNLLGGKLEYINFVIKQCDQFTENLWSFLCGSTHSVFI